MSKSTESPSEATLGRLRAYIHKTQSREYNHTDHLSTRASYDRALEQTLAELEGQLQHEKNRAEEVSHILLTTAAHLTNPAPSGNSTVASMELAS